LKLLSQQKFVRKVNDTTTMKNIQKEMKDLIEIKRIVKMMKLLSEELNFLLSSLKV
jgi:hypothetical protein